jgi:hypothetical protein
MSVRVPFPVLSDERLELTRALGLPTFTTEGLTLHKRHTLIVRDGRIEHVLYPVFPSDQDADHVLAWLTGTPDKPVIGELWLFPEDGAARLISGAPSFLPTGPTCTHDAHLDQTGPNSVSLDIRATCAAPLLPRTPDRSVAVLAPLRANPKIVGFRLAARGRQRDPGARKNRRLLCQFGARQE